MTATYQVLVDDMKALGVEQVFGLMSDDTAVFATALDSSGIRFYGARHENNAIAMAEGYSYGTGGLGVAVIGRGPATANDPPGYACSSSATGGWRTSRGARWWAKQRCSRARPTSTSPATASGSRGGGTASASTYPPSAAAPA